MPMTHIPLSSLGIETDSVTSKTSTLQDTVDLSFMSNSQKDILQIIRKEEDHAMSLLAASPLLSSLFLTYANRAATLDGPPTPSPIDLEWTEMKALNGRLQEQLALLRDQLVKETERARTAEDCVEALRAQISLVKNANRDLETAVSEERARLEVITSEYAAHKEEAADTIAELRDAVDKEAGARAALSQVIADQQISLAQLREKSHSSSSSPTDERKSESSAPASVRNEKTLKQINGRKQQGNSKPMGDTEKPYDTKEKDCTEQSKSSDRDQKAEKVPKDSIKLEHSGRQTGYESEAKPSAGTREQPAAGIWFKSLIE